MAESEKRELVHSMAKIGKLIGVAFIGIGAILSSASTVGLGALKIIGSGAMEKGLSEKKK